jgi:primary-amine oxidase
MTAEQVAAVQGKLEGLDLRTSLPHPLDQLSEAEIEIARQVVLQARGTEVVLNFRTITLEEPPKAELVKFLELEHAGAVTAQTDRPARLAKAMYDIVRPDRSHEYTESLVDLRASTEISQRVVDKAHQAGITT